MIKKERLPQWHKEITENDKLILSDDIDSLFSCFLLKEKFGCEITQFNDFDNLYQLEDTTDDNMIGVDLDIMEGRTFSNHYLYYNNPLAINLSSDIGKYYKKYSFSTALLIYWLYYDKPQSKRMQSLLLAIDSGFKGYYSSVDLFKDVVDKWLKDMDIEYYKDELLNKVDIETMFEIQGLLNLSGKIWIDDKGYLQTDIELERLNKWLDIDIQLPKGKFIKTKSFQRYNTPLDKFKQINKSNIFSHAMTRKTFVSYSAII